MVWWQVLLVGVVGLVFLVGLVIAALQKIGWWPMPESKKREPKEITPETIGKCQDPDCKQALADTIILVQKKQTKTHDELIEIRTNQSSVLGRLGTQEEELKKIGNDVSWIKGYLQTNAKP